MSRLWCYRQDFFEDSEMDSDSKRIHLKQVVFVPIDKAQMGTGANMFAVSRSFSTEFPEGLSHVR